MNSSFNVGEYGQPMLFDAGENLSAYNVEVVIKNPKGVTYTVPAVVGTADTTTDQLGDSYAFEYATYTTTEKESIMEGRWFCRLSCQAEGVQRYSNWVPYYVVP